MCGGCFVGIKLRAVVNTQGDLGWAWGVIACASVCVFEDCSGFAVNVCKTWVITYFKKVGKQVKHVAIWMAPFDQQMCTLRIHNGHTKIKMDQRNTFTLWWASPVSWTDWLVINVGFFNWLSSLPQLGRRINITPTHHLNQYFIKWSFSLCNILVLLAGSAQRWSCRCVFIRNVAACYSLAYSSPSVNVTAENQLTSAAITTQYLKCKSGLIWRIIHGP